MTSLPSTIPVNMAEVSAPKPQPTLDKILSASADAATRTVSTVIPPITLTTGEISTPISSKPKKSVEGTENNDITNKDQEVEESIVVVKGTPGNIDASDSIGESKKDIDEKEVTSSSKEDRFSQISSKDNITTSLSKPAASESIVQPKEMVETNWSSKPRYPPEGVERKRNALSPPQQQQVEQGESSSDNATSTTVIVKTSNETSFDQKPEKETNLNPVINVTTTLAVAEPKETDFDNITPNNNPSGTIPVAFPAEHIPNASLVPDSGSTIYKNSNGYPEHENYEFYSLSSEETSMYNSDPLEYPHQPRYPPQNGISRTQQKLILQRELYLADDENFLIHPRNQLRLTKVIERINREQSSILMYRDPMVESMHRVFARYALDHPEVLEDDFGASYDDSKSEGEVNCDNGGK